MDIIIWKKKTGHHSSFFIHALAALKTKPKELSQWLDIRWMIPYKYLKQCFLVELVLWFSRIWQNETL